MTSPRLHAISRDALVAFGVVGHLLVIRDLGIATAVVSDTALVLVSADGSLRKVTVLPETLADVVIDDGRILVVCLDGRRIEVDA